MVSPSPKAAAQRTLEGAQREPNPVVLLIGARQHHSRQCRVQGEGRKDSEGHGRPWQASATPSQKEGSRAGTVWWRCA